MKSHVEDKTVPIFEVIDGDKHYKIYENGMIDGFSKDAWIINRIIVKEIYLQALGLLERNYQKNPQYKFYELCKIKSYSNKSITPLSPATHAKDSSFLGSSHGVPEYEVISGSAIGKQAGEK